MEKNYSCPLWLTYKQAAELGGQVRKGEKGSLVVYANEIVRTDTDDTGADVEIKIPFMKGYTVQSRLLQRRPRHRADAGIPELPRR